MSSFFKTLGKGFLFIILLPVIVAVAAVILVCLLVYFIFYGFYMFIRLFTKNKITLETEYDKRADKILNPQKYSSCPIDVQNAPAQTNMYNNPQYIQQQNMNNYSINHFQ